MSEPRPHPSGLSEEDLQKLYSFVDEVPLSRPKKNIARDFSDGVLLAEVLKHFFPKLVELHNYSAANSTQQKLYNWNTLNQKVLKRLGINLEKLDIDQIINSKDGKIEQLIHLVQIRYEEKNAAKLFKLQGETEKTNARVQPFNVNAVSSPDKLSNSALWGDRRENSNVPHAKAIPIDPQIQSVMEKKDQTIKELHEHVESLEARILRLEQVVRIKENKIAKLSAKLQKAGLSS